MLGLGRLCHRSGDPNHPEANDRERVGKEETQRQAGCWLPRNVAGCSAALQAKRNGLQNCHSQPKARPLVPPTSALFVCT